MDSAHSTPYSRSELAPFGLRSGQALSAVEWGMLYSPQVYMILMIYDDFFIMISSYLITIISVNQRLISFAKLAVNL